MDPLARLSRLEQFGIKLGLENIRVLCRALGQPQTAYASVVVGGTNGKGSVAAMVERALRAAGHRTGRYTSPHLVRLEERFALDGTPIDDASLSGVAADVLACVERLRAAGDLTTEPTFFEVTTAMAFEWFRRSRVDVAVIEVGLGGRFDATNIVHPRALAITSIDLDHQAQLGTTEQAIAFEKAGLIKDQVPVVVGDLSAQALSVIRQVAVECSARLLCAGEGVRRDVQLVDGRARLVLRTPSGTYGPVTLALRGRHQVDNAVVTVRLLETLSTLGIVVPAQAITTGLTEAVWPGRLQLLELDPAHRVLLDGAHNPAGARVLAAYLQETVPDRLPLVFGVMRDKDARGMLEALAGCATLVVATEPLRPRALPAGEIAALVRQCAPRLPVDTEPDPEAALTRAWGHAPMVCAAGSLFLVGAILNRLETRGGGGPRVVEGR